MSSVGIETGCRKAGFCRTEGHARVTYHGTADETSGVGSFTASQFRYPAAVNRAVSEGWATAEELQEMSLAWVAWGKHSRLAGGVCGWVA